MMSKVVKIAITNNPSQKINCVDSVNVIAGKGLENDRFFKDNNEKGSQLTLIESENIDNFNKDVGTTISYENFRRNIITKNIRLNNLISKEFYIGDIKVLGIDLCEPCLHLQKILKQKNLVKKLVHKAGLRCEILTSGKISVGDIIK